MLRGRLILLFFTFLNFSCSHQITAPYQQISKVPEYLPHSLERYQAKSRQVMVTSEGYYSSQIAAKILGKGGNVADAATALTFAIGVEKPHLTGIGGGGFLLFWKKGMSKPTSFDFREMSPNKATEDMYLDAKGELIKNKSLDGPLANGVPGMVKGILHFHHLYGKLPLPVVMKEVIELARNGFPVTEELAREIKSRQEVLQKYPASKSIFFKNGGEEPLKQGDILHQEDLAHTLELIARHGEKVFYQGEIAQKIIQEEKKWGGIMTAEDLKGYRVKQRRPVHGDYKGYTLYSMAPPSSGGVHVIEILNTVEFDDLAKWGPQHPRSLHLMASAMQFAFADRAKFLGDPDFVHVPMEGLTSNAYAKEVRRHINLGAVVPENKVLPGHPEFFEHESEKTTHFSIMDHDGNTVVSTQSLNGPLGSGFVVAGTGILMNNHMDDFAAKVGGANLFGAVGGYNNRIQAKKRPLSSMSPTIVMKQGKPILALGTRAGTRILTCVAQTILNYLEFKLPLYDAVMSTRFHQQWHPDELRVDVAGFAPEVTEELQRLGYKINYKDLGCRIQAVARSDEGELIGVSDGRGEGLATDAARPH